MSSGQCPFKVTHTNSKYCRFGIRHEIPKLIQDNYLPGKVLEKINTHSYFGFVHYAQNYTISEYESICCIRNCYILVKLPKSRPGNVEYFKLL